MHTKHSSTGSTSTLFENHSETPIGGRTNDETRTSRPFLAMQFGKKPLLCLPKITAVPQRLFKTSPAPLLSTASSTLQPNLAQASRNLSKLVLERNMRSNGFSNAPNATYTNIESAPSLAHPKHYCDLTGLSGPYTDPKTRLRYHDKEIFGVIRTLGQGVAEQYLEARGAHTILK
jgi:hypothetical protein